MDTASSSLPSIRFRPHPQYLILGLGTALLGCHLAWTSQSTGESGSWVMTVICWSVAVWHLQWLGTRLDLGPRSLTFHRPLRSNLAVPWSAIRTVRWTGRITRSLQIEYAWNGEREFLDLPRMRNQDHLHDLILAQPDQPPSPS